MTNRKFIPTQARLHNTAADLLHSMQQVRFRMSDLQTRIDAIDADLDTMHSYFLEKQMEHRSTLVNDYNRWVEIYRHKLRKYTDVVLAIGDGIIGHKIEMKPAALENGKAA